MKRVTLFLSLLVFILLSACSTAPSPTAPLVLDLEVYVDPASGTAVIRTPLETTFGDAPVRSTEYRQVFPVEISATTAVRVVQNGIILVDARLTNLTIDTTYADFGVQYYGLSRNIAQIDSPRRTNSQLGDDELLTPGETTGPLTFIVRLRGNKVEPFSFFVRILAEDSPIG